MTLASLLSAKAASSARRICVTGAASGIGAALCQLLKARGDVPIGVDVKLAADVDVLADLSTPSGRLAMVEGVHKMIGSGPLDGIVANAGTAQYNHSTVSINFFGATATLEGLQPLLLRSTKPRAVATLSVATVLPCRKELVDLMLSGEEEAAIALAKSMESDPAQAALLYSSSKNALARWLRKKSVSPEWAGKGIPLNGVGPTVIETPMVAQFLSTAEGRHQMEKSIPLPLHPGTWGQAGEVAKLLAFLVSEDNSLCSGQVIFIDGGFDALTRGDDIWASTSSSPLNDLSKFAKK
jgi:NAD(P)-dependent dehydrogenase (short-subunit alcohol dehydrogenase family)